MLLDCQNYINSTQLVKRVETVWIYTVAQNDRQFVTLLVCQNYKHCIIHEGVGAFWLTILLKKRISLMRHSSQQSNQSSVHNQWGILRQLGCHCWKVITDLSFLPQTICICKACHTIVADNVGISTHTHKKASHCSNHAGWSARCFSPMSQLQKFRLPRILSWIGGTLRVNIVLLSLCRLQDNDIAPRERSGRGVPL